MICRFNNITQEYDCTDDHIVTWDEAFAHYCSAIATFITLIGGFTFGMILVIGCCLQCLTSLRDMINRMRGIESKPRVIEFAPRPKIPNTSKC